MKTTTLLLLLISLSIKAQTNFIRAEVEYQQGKSLLISGVALGSISATPLLMSPRIDKTHAAIMIPTMALSLTLDCAGVYHLSRGRMIINRKK